VLVFGTDCVTEPMGTVTQPMLTLVVQGAKRSILGDSVFEDHPGPARRARPAASADRRST
jgi:hypothetical protein